MSRFLISGGKSLKGEIKVGGAKNAILPILAASLMGSSNCTIHNVPNLRDVKIMKQLLNDLGAKVSEDGNGVCTINSNSVKSLTVPEAIMRKLRASNLIIGALLGRFGEVNVGYPGGCNIGLRPMDIHLSSFEKMGAEIIEKHGFITAKSNQLKGAEIHLDFPSVGATENVMMAAVFAEGSTIIRNAAREPEIVDLQTFLTGMGAKINGAGTDTIWIEGIKKLGSVEHWVIPDRIEAGTHMIAAAITRGDVLLTDTIPEHLDPLISKLREMGVVVDVKSGVVAVKATKEMTPIDLKTLPYPGFPTDMQPQMMALLSTVPGTSIVIETIFENRFRHVDELSRMGAKIKVDGRVAVVKGVESLSSSKVEATDLRAGAAMVLAGLSAQGKTIVENTHHIERGYELLPEKLNHIGADIKLLD